MTRTAILITTTAALASTLTLLAMVGVGLYSGHLSIGHADPIAMALDTEGAQLAMIYPMGDAGDAEAMASAVAGRRR